MPFGTKPMEKLIIAVNEMDTACNEGLVLHSGKEWGAKSAKGKYCHLQQCHYNVSFADIYKQNSCRC